MTYLRKKISCIYNFPGATSQFRSKKMIYVASFGIVLLFSLFVSIPATIKSAIFIDKGPPGSRDPLKQECRTLDVYTMVFSYFLGSSLLFCFTMSFLFSLCIVGSPYLRDVIDEEEYKQRYVWFFFFFVFFPIFFFFFQFRTLEKIIWWSRFSKRVLDTHVSFLANDVTQNDVIFCSFFSDGDFYLV